MTTGQVCLQAPPSYLGNRAGFACKLPPYLGNWAGLLASNRSCLLTSSLSYLVNRAGLLAHSVNLPKRQLGHYQRWAQITIFRSKIRSKIKDHDIDHDLDRWQQSRKDLDHDLDQFFFNFDLRSWSKSQTASLKRSRSWSRSIIFSSVILDHDLDHWQQAWKI